MDQVEIIYPAIAMFFLSFTLVMTLGLSRFIAIQRGKMSIKFYRTYNEGEQTRWLHLLGRHVQLHFEVPPMFYACTLFLFVTNTVTQSVVYLAWGFFILRCLHTLIHLTKNNVSYRFFCFGSSVIVLALMWAQLLSGLVN